MGINYRETFSPTADMASVRVVKQKAAQKLIVHQIDVKTAYLHAPTDYKIYINPPKGYQEEDDSLVYKLEKSLYGLKQSGPILKSFTQLAS